MMPWLPGHRIKGQEECILGGHKFPIRGMEMLWNAGVVMAALLWKCHWIKYLKRVEIVNLIPCKCYHNFLKKGAGEDANFLKIMGEKSS